MVNSDGLGQMTEQNKDPHHRRDTPFIRLPATFEEEVEEYSDYTSDDEECKYVIWCLQSGTYRTRIPTTGGTRPSSGFPRHSRKKWKSTRITRLTMKSVSMLFGVYKAVHTEQGSPPQEGHALHQASRDIRGRSGRVLGLHV
ncbi:uncharacterized protein LOC124356188 isoform X2 [Homalodisca vitripennis]|uniref:uncharacterized protein LOC124356188 isoform X2 n=1 Tax=Homalodisca vitripennis TaxID=197043 RepID=UPI001EEBD74A|nr:uncharacterized protein LOC124356188 isoform X2 [Homalodisca vitripennis]